MRYITSLIGITLLVLGVFLVQSTQVSAFSILELLGLGEDETEVKKEDANQAVKQSVDKKTTANEDKNEWSKPAKQQENKSPTVDFAYVQRVLANLNAQQRTGLIADENAFKQFIQNEADAQSMLSAAISNNLDKDQNTVFLMQRGAENILRETYLNKLIATKIPADFPNDQQVSDYYDQNKEKFVIGKRVHVWQIFLPIEKDIDKAGIEKVKKKARSIINDINKKKIDFATAANKYSAHEASRNNGGYMGLLKVAELLPGIEKPLLKLKEGHISDPVKTDAGVHIFKRGAILDQVPVSLASVEGQIKQLLIKQVRQQLRHAVFQQARTTYPVSLKDTQIEEWRLRLKTKLAN